MNKEFILRTINGTFSTLLLFSFIAFIIFALNDKTELWQGSLIVFFVSLSVTLLTPNTKEINVYLNKES